MTQIGEDKQAAPMNSQHFEIDSIWRIVKENSQMYISKRDFIAWFKPSQLQKIENGIAEIGCPTPYIRERLETYHRALLKKLFLEATGQKLEIIFTVNDSLKKEHEFNNDVYFGSNGASLFSANEQKPEVEKEDIIRKAQLNPKYLLSNFIVGPHNRLAHAVAEAIIDDLGRAYNPVFFYGSTGVGKTHLMQAIGNAVLDRNLDKKVVYASIEQFLNELIAAIRTKSTEEFRKKYRAIDLLILDDIQFVETYPTTQEELFHTFNTLYQANKQIIMAADRPPKDIKNITDRLRSRFEGGMVADLQIPEYEARMAILNHIAIDQGVDLDKGIAELIAKNVSNSVRELEGAATKIITMMKYGNNMSLDDVARTLQFDLETKRRRLRPEKIMDAVCEVFDVTKKDIKGSRRTAYVALSRQVVMYLLREELKLPLEKIAREVNRKDHTTVLHACEKVEGLIKEDKHFGQRMDNCMELLSK